MRSSLDKLPIYVALGVPEAWRYTEGEVEIRCLIGDAYMVSDTSQVLPGVSADVVQECNCCGESPLSMSMASYRACWLLRHRWSEGRRSQPACHARLGSPKERTPQVAFLATLARMVESMLGYRPVYEAGDCGKKELAL
jgi:hypothetical protein